MTEDTTLTTTDEIQGITVTLKTEGPELQDGHELGADGLHLELQRAISEVIENHD